MDALQRHDLDALAAAIEAEHQIIEEQRLLVAELRWWSQSGDGG